MSDLAFACNVPSALKGDSPEVLTRIYDDGINLAIWQKQADTDVEEYAQFLTGSDTLFSQFQGQLAADAAPDLLASSLPEHTNKQAFLDEVSLIVDMFCCLFEQKAAGVRIAVLNSAMCPKFHTDHVPCRLVTTFTGDATEWLENYDVNRNKMGRNSIGKSDKEAGVYRRDNMIQKMSAGHIALLKGSGWQGNEDNGAVHRSPAPVNNEFRLVMTLDFAE